MGVGAVYDWALPSISRVFICFQERPRRSSRADGVLVVNSAEKSQELRSIHPWEELEYVYDEVLSPGYLVKEGSQECVVE